MKNSSESVEIFDYDGKMFEILSDHSYFDEEWLIK
jgi:hypothetical protein